MRWAQQAAHIGAGEVSTGFWWRDLIERDHLQDVGVDGIIILKGSSVNGIGRHGLVWSGSGWGQMAGICECGNEHSGSIKCGEISWVDEELLAFKEGLCCEELVI